MNLLTFKKVATTLMNHNIVPFVWGNQGIGKTQSVKQIAKEQGVEFVHLHLATQEVGDLVGLLTPNGRGEVHHARPEWFPTKGKGIVFLDELNRAHPDVLQAMFSFITSKTIHTHQLPEGWKIVAAGNYQSENFQVTDTSDAAWMSRFCHIHLEPTVEEFAIHAESRGYSMLADFALEHPDMLESKFKPVEVVVTPDRRAFLEMIAPLDAEDMSEETRYEVYSGIVGQIAASRYITYGKTAEKKIKLKDILLDYNKVRNRVLSMNREKETRFDALAAPIDELVTRLKENQYVLDEKSVVEFQNFMLDLPLELISQTVKKLGKLNFREKDSIINNPEFTKALLGNKKKK